MDKSEYGGSGKDKNDDRGNGNEADSNISFDNASAQSSKPSRRKETAPRAEKTKLKVEKVVEHKEDEYYRFPEGRRFMNCKGMPDMKIQGYKTCKGS